MKFYLTDTEERKEINVRPWTGSGYGPDCFSDLEPNFPRNHETLDGSFEIACTAAEYKELAEWWTEEIRRMNARERGQNGDDYGEDWCPAADELVIFAD